MKKLLSVALAFFAVALAQAQDYNPITTGVPFLQIAADARSAGLGDQGVATTADAFSQQYNPAKYAFSLDKQGFSVSYTPYLTSLVNDISLGQVTYFNRLNERSAVAGSIRYFSLGNIALADNTGSALGEVKPNEFALDGSYALKLSENFSMSVAGRYIRSNLGITTDGASTRAATSFAFDVAGFYQSPEFALSDFNGRWRAGFNLQNLGPKINYDLTESSKGSNFLPSNLKLGGAFDFILDEYNKVSLNLELNKLLIPTPQNADLNGDGIVSGKLEEDQRAENIKNYNNTGWSSGITKSFGDAPGGFSEELKEITYAVGAEYLYQDSFALRTGYFHESPMKGARKYFTLGAGFKYTAIKVDVSYLFSVSNVRNPLENTLRFSLSFNFGDQYDEN